MMAAGEKKCRGKNGCGLLKPLSEFVARKRAKDGLGCHCKDCDAKERAAYRKTDVGRLLTVHWNRKSRRKNPISFLVETRFTSAKRRAAKKGIEFSLSKDMLRKKIEVGVCPRTGEKFNLNVLVLGKKTYHNYLSPSIQRTDSSSGYTDEGTEVVTWIYNSCAGEGTHAHVQRFALAVVMHDFPETKAALQPHYDLIVKEMGDS